MVPDVRVHKALLILLSRNPGVITLRISRLLPRAVLVGCDNVLDKRPQPLLPPGHACVHRAFKADCKLLDLPVSGNKGQFFDRLQGYVDGTVRPKKRRR